MSSVRQTHPKTWINRQGNEAFPESLQWHIKSGLRGDARTVSERPWICVLTIAYRFLKVNSNLENLQLRSLGKLKNMVDACFIAASLTARLARCPSWQSVFKQATRRQKKAPDLLYNWLYRAADAIPLILKRFISEVGKLNEPRPPGRRRKPPRGGLFLSNCLFWWHPWKTWRTSHLKFCREPRAEIYLLKSNASHKMAIHVTQNIRTSYLYETHYISCFYRIRITGL